MSFTPRSGSANSLLRRAASAFGLLTSSLVLAQAVASCGSEEGPCTPGESASCQCGNGLSGFRVCNNESPGFGECDCSSGGSAGSNGAGDRAMAGTGGGNSGAAGSAPDGSLPPLTNAVGAPCESDSDCPGVDDVQLICIPSTSNQPFGTAEGGGGPEGGYCSYPCTPGSTECERDVDGNSACVLQHEGQDVAYCAALCEPGGGPTGQGNIKCGNDRVQACGPGAAGEDICLPTCRSDDGCGNGRFCSPKTGLCVDEARSGGGVGAACTPDTQMSDCASGRCVQLGSEFLCTSFCAFAILDSGCGSSGISTIGAEAACLATAVTDGAPGDLGFCIELCDVDGDCAQESFACEKRPELADTLGRAGNCVPAALLNPPADGGVDAAVDGG